MSAAVPLTRLAEPGDLDELARLFDAYRQFYEQPADLARAREFLAARQGLDESWVLVAPRPDGAPGLAGFVQLYPTWCSVAAAPIAVLYDLFVDPACRRVGVAQALMQAAADLGRARGLARLDLTTARSNAAAQALYRAMGWTLDEVYLTFNLAL